MTELTISIPTYVELPRKTKKDKRVSINMNWYRNAMFHESNQTKKIVKELVADHLLSTEQGLNKFTDPVYVVFRLHKKTKIRTDKSNFYAVAAKFVLDALTELGIIEDDNDDFIKDEHQMPTLHDKDNPRLEFFITDSREEFLEIVQENC